LRDLEKVFRRVTSRIVNEPFLPQQSRRRSTPRLLGAIRIDPGPSRTAAAAVAPSASSSSAAAGGGDDNAKSAAQRSKASASANSTSTSPESNTASSSSSSSSAAASAAISGKSATTTLVVLNEEEERQLGSRIQRARKMFLLQHPSLERMIEFAADVVTKNALAHALKLMTAMVTSTTEQRRPRRVLKFIEKHLPLLQQEEKQKIHTSEFQETLLERCTISLFSTLINDAQAFAKKAVGAAIPALSPSATVMPVEVVREAEKITIDQVTINIARQRSRLSRQVHSFVEKHLAPNVATVTSAAHPTATIEAKKSLPRNGGFGNVVIMGVGLEGGELQFKQEFARCTGFAESNKFFLQDVSKVEKGAGVAVKTPNRQIAGHHLTRIHTS